MPRLAEALMDTDGEASFRLRFSRDGARRAVIYGEVRASLKLVCQRCMGLLEHVVDLTFTLAPIRVIDEVRLLPDRYEPLLVADERVRAWEVIEDELLLALPQIPSHPAGECEPPGKAASAGEQDSEVSHPFAVLSDRGLWSRD
jgi:uncharacterized protein